LRVPLIAAAVRPVPLALAVDCGVQLRLLNAFELVAEGRPITLPMTVRRLIALLAIKRHPVLRNYVAGVLWTNSSEERAQASLRSALWQLHRSSVDVVQVSRNQLRLNEGVRVDLHDAEALAKLVLDGLAPVDRHVDLAGLDGDVLPDWYDDWVLIEREQFRQLRLRALETLCHQLTDAGRLDDALAAGLRALAGEPLRESVHRALVGVHIADGNAAEAIRQYRFCRRLLREHLGIEPSVKTKEQIRELYGRGQLRGRTTARDGARTRRR
jgi:DNA-binding SARP family transcriptional activator